MSKITDVPYWFIKCLDDTGTCGLLHNGIIYSTKTPLWHHMIKIEELGFFCNIQRFKEVPVPDIEFIRSWLR